jgi:hypothetical protein
MTTNSDLFNWDTVAAKFLLPQSLQERTAVNQNFANNPEHVWLVKNLGHLNFAFNMFGNNAKSFLRFCQDLHQTEHVDNLKTINSEYFDKRYRYANESSTLLLNFLSSMNMLIDITRRIVQCEVEDKNFEDKVNKQIEILFGQTGLGSFLKDLRNFALHRTVVVTMPIDIGERFEVCLETAEIRQWGKIKTSTLKFIDDNEVDLSSRGNGKVLPIQSCVRNYLDLQSKFNAWLFNSILTLKQDIAEVNNQFIESLR